MGTRGPKSGNEIATIGPAGIEVRRRLDPPEDLTAEAAEVWRGIVNANPADLFSPGSAPLLAQLCRHTVAARRVAQWLAKIEQSEGALDEARWFKLLARQESESKVIAQGDTSAPDAAIPLHASRGGNSRAESKNRPGAVERPLAGAWRGTWKVSIRRSGTQRSAHFIAVHLCLHPMARRSTESLHQGKKHDCRINELVELLCRLSE
jgi:hypothetical protein